MTTTNDQSTNLNPTLKKTEENVDFDINLDEATKNDSVDININKEPEKNVVEDKNEDNSLDLPDSYFAKEAEEAEIEKKIETKPDSEPVLDIKDKEKTQTTDTSWLQVQDQQNKEEEKSLFDSEAINQTINLGSTINADVTTEIKSDSISQPENTKGNTTKLDSVINIDSNNISSKFASF